MAASVRIEDDAFTDARLVVLAESAHYRGGHYEALGRMAHLWRTCTATQQHVLSEAIVRAHLGKLGPEAIVASGLGERVEGGIRIKGTAGRIEWLARVQAGARQGGSARASQAARDGSGRFGSSSADPASRLVGASQPPSSGRLDPLVQPSSVVAVAVVPAVAVQPGEVSPDPSCPEPAASGVSEPPADAFPTVGRGPGFWLPTAAEFAAWTAAYPGVSLETELAKARAWCVSNPTRRKTARGMPAFVNRWLSKAQDDGGNGASPPRRDAAAEKSAGRLGGIRRFMEKRAKSAPARALIGGGND